MRIFLTGASGFIGSRILPALQASGHQVIGLARSESTAQALKAAGAEVHRGTLDAPESLLAGVGNADAVIHTAFDHDFSRFAANCEKDRQAILALGQALRGSTRPLVITSGTLMGDDGSGAPARESFFNSAHPSPRTASELVGQQLLEAGVDVRVVRLPQVHDTVRQGLLTCYIERAIANGAVALRGEGLRLLDDGGHVARAEGAAYRGYQAVGTAVVAALGDFQIGRPRLGRNQPGVFSIAIQHLFT